MDPPDSSRTCHLPSNNNSLYCTMQQEYFKCQSDEFYEALEPVVDLTSNTVQRKSFLSGLQLNAAETHITASASRRCWGSVFCSVAVLSPGLVSGRPALFSHVSGSRCLAPFKRASTQSTTCHARSRASMQRHPPHRSHRNQQTKTGFNTGTLEVISNTLFFSLRCCQPYNPAGICQPALRAGHGKSNALGFAIVAPQRIVTISTGAPKHRTLQGSV